LISNFLIRTFIKDKDNVSNNKVREQYGYLGGVVGVIVNIILFVIKFIVGIISGSIAVTADAFNNLSDVMSSTITIVGFKLANKPADEEHPFGHGRIEYLSALAVGCLVLMVAFSFVKTSVGRIIKPEPVIFEIIPFALIIISIALKFWLSRFNKNLGDTIDSSALKAASVDAISDVVSSTVVAISLVISSKVSFPVDGILGVIVSLFILYSGINILKETVNPLLGSIPNGELVKKIEAEVLSYPSISGVHDLIIHSYGPNKYMASIHAEVPSSISIIEIHEIIDKAEKEISEKLNVLLVIHMDPINDDDDETNLIRGQIKEIIKEFNDIISFHDLRVVNCGEERNVIFDVVITHNIKRRNEQKDVLVSNLIAAIKAEYPNYNPVIAVDIDYGTERNS